MTDEQRAAFINSQTACAVITAMGMQAENQSRADRGLSPAYGEDAFQALINQHGIGHNDVVGFFHQ